MMLRTCFFRAWQVAGTCQGSAWLVLCVWLILCFGVSVVCCPGGDLELCEGGVKLNCGFLKRVHQCERCEEAVRVPSPQETCKALHVHQQDLKGG